MRDRYRILDAPWWVSVAIAAFVFAYLVVGFLDAL